MRDISAAILNADNLPGSFIHVCEFAALRKLE